MNHSTNGAGGPSGSLAAPLTALFGSAVLLLWGAPLWAAGGGGGHGDGHGAADAATSNLEVILLLVAIVGFAYLITHLLLERLAEQYGVVSGVEYVVLGAVVFQLIVVSIFPPGPGDTPMAVVHEILARLRPIEVLGTGLLGLMVGLHFDREAIPEDPGRYAGPAFLISAGTFGAVVLLPALVLGYVYSFEFVEGMMPALMCAGAIAMVASDAPIRSLISFLGATGKATTVAIRTARACSAIAIMVFGAIYCFDHVSPILPGGKWEWLEWLAIYLVVGVALGTIFGVYLRRDFSDDKILTVVIGMAVFSSGIADALNLSPIFLNFILGVVLINTSYHGDHVREMLGRIEHPLYIVLFIFAGANVDLNVPLWSYALALPYLVLRLGGRWLGGLIGPAHTDAPSKIPPLGRILLAPGALSVAMALDFLMIYKDRDLTGVGPFFGTAHDVDIVYTGLITAIIISEVLAYLTSRAWLIDAADVSPTQSHRGGDADTPTRPPDSQSGQTREAG